MLEKIISSKSKVKILRRLVENPKREFCIEDIVKATKLSFGTAHPTLKDMVSSRMIISRKVGRSTLYKVNDRNPLFPKLKDLFGKEKTMMEDIASEFVTELEKSGIKAIVLFGSVARGEVTEKSDIDLLLILEDDEKTKQKVSDFAKRFLDRYDVEIIPTFLSTEESRRRFKKADKFILNVAAEGKVLYGGLDWLEK